MIKIGFIDNFLSEWHANNYPDMIRANERARSLGMDVCYAYAKEEVSPYDGVTTDEWCRAHGVRRVGSVEELVDRSDCIAVLSPDNPELHLALSEYALKSGKPTYIDKTFAPDKATAEKLFALAKEHGTPMYSTSSLRFADEMKFTARAKSAQRAAWCAAVTVSISTRYTFSNLWCTIMKTGAKRMMAVQTGRNRNIVVDYGGGRSASFLQMHTDDPIGVPFITSAQMPDGSAHYYTIADGYQTRFCGAPRGIFRHARTAGGLRRNPSI